MIPETILLSFNEIEQDTYNRQGEYGYFKLDRTKDALDIYSCHSQPHVLEVITQSRELYQALCPLLKSINPEWIQESVLEALLTAAKLHDISMGGNPKELRLLDAVDSMYEWLKSDCLKCSRDLRKRGEEIKYWAEKTQITQGKYRELEALLSIMRLDEQNCRKLDDTLEIYHDEIKTFIRKHHAPSGAKWVFKHATQVLKRYGLHLDLNLIAALICLHSTSSTPVDAISCAGDKKEEMTRQVLWNFMKDYLMPYELEEFFEEKSYKKIIYLASILRLADTRRQGDRAKTIDLKELQYQLCEDGTADLYRMMPWGPERITDRLAHSILLSECCTRFEPVFLQRRHHECYTLVHKITLCDAQNKEICEQFFTWRLYSYVKEVDTGAFRDSEKIHNTFRITLNQITDKNIALTLQEAWQKQWKNGDEMQQRYAAAIEVQTMPKR